MNSITVHSVTDYVRKGGSVAVEDVVRAFQYNTPGCVLKALAAAVQDGVLVMDPSGYLSPSGARGGCGDD